MCKHFPSPYIGYDYETDTFYCALCDVEFKVEEDLDEVEKHLKEICKEYDDNYEKLRRAGMLI